MRVELLRGWCGPSIAMAAALVLAVEAGGDGVQHGAEADTRLPQATEVAEALGIDREERDRLRALGYVGVGEPLAADAEVGVLKFDRERSQPGLNLFTNADFCSAQLIDPTGTLVHQWSRKPCKRWSSAFLAKNGDLLVLGRAHPAASDPDSYARARFILRLSWEGELLWKHHLPVHHDLDLQPDGRMFGLSYRYRMLPEVHESVPVRDHSLVLMSALGEVLAEASLYQMLAAASDVLSLTPVEARWRSGELSSDVDLIHANSVERMPYPELVKRGPLYADDHVLVCLRSQDLLVVVDWSERRIVWAWGAGELSGPHDASWLPNGNILVFDNGLGRGWSRVVELNPLTREIVWQYTAPVLTDLYTKTQGTNQRLANGNTLITESGSGRALEVTPEGDVVWEFRNFNLTQKREPNVIPRLRRLQGLDFAELERALKAGEPLPRMD